MLDFYTGVVRASTASMPPSPSARLADPAAYLPAPDLVDAVNVALLLGQPLLLTGEPGCGKTQLADNLAWSLGLGPLLKFETKSDSTADSLFYRYDSLRRFEASSRHEVGDPARFLTWTALGRAILATLPPEQRARFCAAGDDGSAPRRSVVLIDEIDKAPRDFPNDVLNELEHLYFRIPELGDVVLRADNRHRPIVVITSNSERDLPEPFLRRCVFHHVTFPDDETLRRIALSHLGAHVRGLDPLLDQAVSLFTALRADGTGLSRRPGLAEFLNWLVVLAHAGTDGDPLGVRTLHVTIGVLAKTAADVERANGVLTAWLADRNR
ncbi:AAA family ATPase [Virgisporangium aurantiacum]|uniref:ATPase AAA n=1 Tax=Virgisporangium aurantiacum TaxID=175570 RepID=A0A8J3Z4Q1_9ACTN|nr:MoxR family ATPase [Virgisporangium aurantiacum]GIJ57499.1 ATPase AAA [Virgisporangium aurantiacum]